MRGHFSLGKTAIFCKVAPRRFHINCSWHDDMMTWWHDDMMTWWHDDMMPWWHGEIFCWRASARSTFENCHFSSDRPPKIQIYDMMTWWHVENFCIPARALSPFENCHFWSHRPPKFSIHQIAPIKNGQFLVGATWWIVFKQGPNWPSGQGSGF